MGRLTFLLVGLLMGGAAVAVGFNYHIVQTPKEMLFVAKQSASLKDTYVDIRSWGVKEWTSHPELSNALIKSGHGELITHSVAGNILDGILEETGIKK